MKFKLIDTQIEHLVKLDESFYGDVHSNEYAFFVLNTLAKYTEKEVGSTFVDAILFGSRAKEENEESSDIDICLVLNCHQNELNGQYRYLSSEKKFDLVYTYGVPIDLIRITHSELNTPKRMVTRLMRKEGVFWSQLGKRSLP